MAAVPARKTMSAMSLFSLSTNAMEKISTAMAARRMRSLKIRRSVKFFLSIDVEYALYLRIIFTHSMMIRKRKAAVMMMIVYRCDEVVAKYHRGKTMAKHSNAERIAVKRIYIDRQ